MHLIAGVDEVGRGPLAGPVIAAAVILPKGFAHPLLRDSKKLSAQQRELVFSVLQREALDIGVGRAEAHEIDEINILQASLLAMSRAIQALSMIPSHVQVDGLYIPQSPYSIEAIVKGDSLIPEISAASIIAKVLRDREMIEMDSRYPGYGFSHHSGYPTAAHVKALSQLGPCPIHRKSFGPVKALLKTFSIS